MGYIGITDNRLKHMRAVAEKCYRLAKEDFFPEEFARRMYFLGFVHDIGYRFSEESSKHPDRSAEMMILSGIDPGIETDAVRNHGKLPEGHETFTTDEWKILAKADLTVDSDGNEVPAETRLRGIMKRYGKDSHQYKNAVSVAEKLGLV